MLHKKILIRTCLVVLLIYGMAGCSTNDQLVPASDSTSSTGIAKAPDENAFGHFDPDPTDSFPAGSYLLNGANVETAAKVRVTLEDSLVKDELTIMESSQRRFIIHDIDLNDDGMPETFVTILNAYFCSGAGCTVWLLNDDATLNTIFTGVEFPIVAMHANSRHWKDLLVTSGGEQYIVKYSGKEYTAKFTEANHYDKMPDADLPLILDYLHVPYPRFAF